MLDRLDHDFSQTDWLTNQYFGFNTHYEPYLIQRGTFKDIPESEIVGLDSLISYDYMGASEFEWGALPASLKQICQHWSAFALLKISEIKNLDGEDCYVFCHTGCEEKVTEVIKKLFIENCPYRLHEWSGCYEYVNTLPRSQYSTIINFWWDIDHHWMCCFGNNIKKLIIAIQKIIEKKSTEWSITNAGPGPIVIESITKPTTTIVDTTISGLITITTISGVTTKLACKRIHSLKVFMSTLDIGITNKSGREMVVQITDIHEDDPKKKVLVKLINDAIETNQIQQREGK